MNREDTDQTARMRSLNRVLPDRKHFNEHFPYTPLNYIGQWMDMGFAYLYEKSFNLSRFYGYIKMTTGP